MLTVTPIEKYVLSLTRAESTMREFNLEDEERLSVDIDRKKLQELIDFSIGILGEACLTEVNDKDKVKFAADYFNAFNRSKVIEEISLPIRLLASMAFILSGLVGNARILINKLDLNTKNCFEWTLVSLILEYEDDFVFESNSTEVEKLLNNTLSQYFVYRNTGESVELLVEKLDLLKELRITLDSYSYYMLLMIEGYIKNYISNSAWALLPKYTNQNIELWRTYIQKDGSIKEFWPAQKLIGEKGILAGKSALIQLPTSAGKTRSVELMIRSAFLGGRTGAVLIVAPFRSLCQEIFQVLTTSFIGEDVNITLVSDVLQSDFSSSIDQNSVIILTPEKLGYLLRQQEDIYQNFGLIIYDEAHIIDESTRGTKYELLLSAIKLKVQRDIQVVVMSAVLPNNGNDIQKWLNIEQSEVVQQSIQSNSRNIAFASKDGNIHFVDSTNPSERIFFVPKVIKAHNEFPKREGNRYYPPDIAILLALKLIQTDTVAIYAVKITTLTGVLNRLTQLSQDTVCFYNRTISNIAESTKLQEYIQSIYGADSVYLRASKMGFYSHHNGVPEGLRLATEYELSYGKEVKAIVCTSTLAQGVNLPIRYLIITNQAQASQEPIKVRDFHNLMGRAGRVGKKVEGTVIFADSSLYDDQRSFGWAKTARLLKYQNAEQCISRILRMIKGEISDPTQILEIKREVHLFLTQFSLSHDLRDAQEVKLITSNTLAYEQASISERLKLEELFNTEALSILETEPDLARRIAFSKSTLDLKTSQDYCKFLSDHSVELFLAPDNIALLKIIFPFAYEIQNNKAKQKLTYEQYLSLCIDWISGKKYISLFSEYTGETQLKDIDIVRTCENDFAFQLSILIGAAIEILPLVTEFHDLDSLKLLQKAIRYGLPTKKCIRLYEIGFKDRMIAQHLEEFANRMNAQRMPIRTFLKENYELLKYDLNKFPAYFTAALDRLI